MSDAAMNAFNAACARANRKYAVFVVAFEELQSRIRTLMKFLDDAKVIELLNDDENIKSDVFAYIEQQFGSVTQFVSLERKYVSVE